MDLGQRRDCNRSFSDLSHTRARHTPLHLIKSHHTIAMRYHSFLPTVTPTTSAALSAAPPSAAAAWDGHTALRTVEHVATHVLPRLAGELVFDAGVSGTVSSAAASSAAMTTAQAICCVLEAVPEVPLTALFARRGKADRGNERGEEHGDEHGDEHERGDEHNDGASAVFGEMDTHRLFILYGIMSNTYLAASREINRRRCAEQRLDGTGNGGQSAPSFGRKADADPTPFCTDTLRLPRNLARPFHAVARRLGRPAAVDCTLPTHSVNNPNRNTA